MNFKIYIKMFFLWFNNQNVFLKKEKYSYIYKKVF